MSKTIMELGAFTCRWPEERNAEGARLFCGAPTGDPLKVYCERHHLISYIQPRGHSRPVSMTVLKRIERRSGGRGMKVNV